MNNKKRNNHILKRIDGAIEEGSLIRLGIIRGKKKQRLGDSCWMKLVTKSGSVEGKLHLPNRNTEKIIIFMPGCPGDGSTRLEHFYLRDLITHNYAVWAIRHNGTILNKECANKYLNCAPRRKRAEEKKEFLLGGKDFYTIEDLLREPYISLEVFSLIFREIYLVGHSLGPLAILSSLIDFSKHYHERKGRIKCLISLAGMVGVIKSEQDPLLFKWSEYLNSRFVKGKIEIGDLKSNIGILKKTYIKIRKEGKNIPKPIRLIFISPWGYTENSLDEGVTPAEVIDTIVILGRGYLVIDKTQRSDRKKERIVHDMDNLKAETLLKFLDKKWLPRRQILTIQ